MPPQVILAHSLLNVMQSYSTYVAQLVAELCNLDTVGRSNTCEFLPFIWLAGLVLPYAAQPI